MDTVARGNRFAHALLGVYVYAGAPGTLILRQTFLADRENLRIRADAPRAAARPVPARSEVRR